MLTKQEIDTLKSLLDRAIENGQFILGIESPFASPDEDWFGEGDRHDGNCVTNQAWTSYASACNCDDGEDHHELKLLIDQRSADYIAIGELA